MKLLLIFVVISIHTSGLLTTAEAKCDPRYDGGYGGPGRRNVEPKWTFNPPTNQCELVMTKGKCSSSWNCFQNKDDCDYECDPKIQRWKQQFGHF
uniref:Putative secreted protein n=1 Tax=Ixodes ricinus TaxID=34613 RepID=V5I2K1_IXORI